MARSGPTHEPAGAPKRCGATNDPHDLKRFLDAQDQVYGNVLAEFSSGRKRGHWMWFVFPQVVGLDTSPMAQRFGIASLAEACAYLEHPVLGARLHECAVALLSITDKSAREVLGTPEDLKLRSCMTLFAAVDPSRGEFTRVLERYFGGQPDPLTLAALTGWRTPSTSDGR